MLPHLVAVIVFIVFSFAYFSPVLEGKQLLGHDTESWMFMAKETITHNEKHDDVTLWTNSMFGGMPNYQISMRQPYNVLKVVESVFMKFGSPVNFLLLYLVGFYVMLLAFRLKPWMALVGSFVFTFASYNLIIIAAGHNSKAITIAYMAPLIGSILLAYRESKIGGSLLTAFFLSLAVRANHIQILYYTLIVMLFYIVVEAIYSYKEKRLKHYFQTSFLMVGALTIAVGMNATSLLTTNEYSKYTMRGESTGLTIDSQSVDDGLSREYITQWSYGIDETLTLLIPNFKGGASGTKLGIESETAKEFERLFGARQTKEIMDSFKFNTYWGTQPGTSGPVYFGAIVLFLFVLGLFVTEKKLLWWLIPVIILTLMLSWGRNFQWLTDIFIDHVPLYNKFRTVSMILVATGFAITLIAVLTLKKILTPGNEWKNWKRPLLISTSVTGGIALLFALIPSLAGNFSNGDADLHFARQLTAAYETDFSFLTDTLPADRMDMLRSDAIRSLCFILAFAGLVWLYLQKKIKEKLTVILMAALLLLDLIPVARRYLNEDNFERKRTFANVIKPSEADKFILQDTTQFRVLNLTVNVFNDASPSYFHHNIGGYHAAKLRRYQELINLKITPELEELFKIRTHEDFDSLAPTLDVLNMLNMKYVIVDPNSMPLINPYANGNAWLVDDVFLAKNADEEIKMLSEIDPKNTLVVDQQFKADLSTTFAPDTAAFIRLISYKPNHLVYEFSSTTDQIAVFSEIFYPRGWYAYINGESVPYFRANFLLRAMNLDAGTYTIEFKFKPQSYRIGNIIALLSSILLCIAIVTYFGVKWFAKRKSKLSENKLNIDGQNNLGEGKKKI